MLTTGSEKSSAEIALNDKIIKIIFWERRAKREFALFDVWLNHVGGFELRTVNCDPKVMQKFEMVTVVSSQDHGRSLAGLAESGCEAVYNH